MQPAADGRAAPLRAWQSHVPFQSMCAYWASSTNLGFPDTVLGISSSSPPLSLLVPRDRRRPNFIDSFLVFRRDVMHVFRFRMPQSSSVCFPAHRQAGRAVGEHLGKKCVEGATLADVALQVGPRFAPSNGELPPPIHGDQVQGFNPHTRIGAYCVRRMFEIL